MRATGGGPSFRAVLPAVGAVLALTVMGGWWAPACRAEGAEPPSVDSGVRVAFVTPESGNVSADFRVHRYPADASGQGADGLRTTLRGGGAESLRRELLDFADRSLGNAVRGLLPGLTISLAPCVLDEASLVDEAGTDGFHPPVVMRTVGSLALSPSAFGLPSGANLSRLTELLLADGARLCQTLELELPAGHRLELEIQLFQGAVFHPEGGARRTFTADGSGSSAPGKWSFRFVVASAEPSSEAERVQVAGRADLLDFTRLVLEGRVEFCRADPSRYWTPPPQIVGVGNLSGGTLSELARSRVLSTSAVYEAVVHPVQANLERRLGALFNLSLNLSPEWSTAGNLTCRLRAYTTGASVFGLSGSLVRAALVSGALYRFELPLSVGWPLEMVFVPPPETRMEGLEELVEADGRTAYSWRCPSGSGTIAVGLRWREPLPPTEEVRASVVADFGEPGLGLGEVLVKGSTTVPVHLEASVRVSRVNLPQRLSSTLPANLTLPVMTADLLRVLLDEGHVSELELENFLTDLLPRIEPAVRSALGGTGRTKLRFDEESLRIYDLDRLDGGRPVEVVLQASGQRTKGLELFKAVPCSPGLVRVSQDFSLKGVAGWNVTYRMRFDPGLKLAGVSARGARATVGNDGGRDFFEVSFGRAGGNATVTAYLEPTPGLLLVKLGPQLCPGALAVVAAIAAALFLRRRRRRAALSRRGPGKAGGAREAPGSPFRQSIFRRV